MSKYISCGIVMMFLFMGCQSLLDQNQKTEEHQQGSHNKALNHSEPATSRSKLGQRFLKWRFGLFMHFNMSTYIDKEWANGYEDPVLFSPDKLNFSDIANTAMEAGMKYGVLTVKHTGGWCLWDSQHTTHDITQFVNYKNGKGDIVREYVDAFRQKGLGVGLYYCFPGDFQRGGISLSNPLPTGKPNLYGLPPEAAGDYVGFIKKQISELLTNYGPIDILWIDQYANKYTGDNWREVKAYIHSLQPDCLVVANNAKNLEDSDIYGCELDYDPKCMPYEDNTLPAEVCQTISGGWFWNTHGSPEKTKSAAEIVEMLNRCNTRNANYLLNVPPDRDGQIKGTYKERLQEVGRLLKASGSDTM